MSSSINMSLDQAIQSRKDSGKGDWKSRSSPMKHKKIFKRRFGSPKPFSFKDRRDSRRERPFGLKKKFGGSKFNSRFIRRTKPSRFAPRRYQEKPISPRKLSGEESNKTEEQTKLKISNLDWNVVQNDLFELFSKLGNVVKNKIIYDSLGRSKGKAFVEFEKAENAAEAIKEYNGVDLDGRTITVEYDDEPRRSPKKNFGVLRKKISKGGYKRDREFRRRYDDDFKREGRFRRYDDDFRRDDRFRRFGGFRKEGGFRREREERGFGFKRGGFRKFDGYRSNKFRVA